MQFKNKGFTLAEILLALTIIGVVAAITIPNIVNHYKDEVTVRIVTKFYSNVAQAYTKLLAEEGPPDIWEGLTESTVTNGKIFYEQFKPYLIIQYDCSNNKPGCFPSSRYKTLSGELSSNFTTAKERYNAILNDGAAISFLAHPKSKIDKADIANNRENNYGVVYIDVNGSKPPNVHGKDLFGFDITKHGIFPSPLSKGRINDCVTIGYSCSGWVISHKNLDYLYCPQKIKNGASSCGFTK